MEEILAPPIEQMRLEFEKLQRKCRSNKLDAGETERLEQLSLEIGALPLAADAEGRSLEKDLREKVESHKEAIAALE